MKRKIPAETRKIIEERDKGACQWDDCKLSRNSGDRMNLHHVHPEQFGGTEDPNNLVTLCDIHHKMMHAEFHAYYPDSEGVLLKMNRLTKNFLSKYRKLFGVDDGYDLTPVLYFLTKNTSFRPGQLATIRAATRGESVLLVTPTGSGKSVCYQLPGLLASSPTLVVSPLKALMKDQMQSIWARKIPTTYINSDLADSEKKKRYEFIAKGLYRFIFVTPERFDSKDLNTQKLYTKYAYLVIDEAHAIEMWGMAFRPAYRKLGELRSNLGKPPTIALTATANKNTQQEIIKSLGINNAEIIVTGFYRDNIEIIVHKAGFLDDYNQVSMGKERYLLELIHTNQNQKILIFCPTIKKAEDVANMLSANSIDAGLYHAKLDAKQKMKIQNQFTGTQHPEINVLVSTSAFGMGIDIPNIRHVVHYAPPLNITDYVQQIGRAGRDGKQSMAHLLWHPKDFNLLDFMSMLPLKAADFQTKYSYSNEDLKIVEQKLEQQVNEMAEFVQLPDGMYWDYILKYFQEQKPTFWQRYGIKIADSILVAVISLCLLLILIFVIYKISYILG